MRIRQLQPEDRADLIRMQRALLPWAGEELDARFDDLLTEGRARGVPRIVFVAQRDNGRVGGYVECSLRNVADGCDTTPVGYLEAWYVDEDWRRGGVGKALVEAAENWARERGCREMASDCLIDNPTSELAHRSLGFEEVDRCINFRRALPGDRPFEHTASDWIELTALPLSVARAVHAVTDPRAGGIDVFLGTTRAETSPDGRQLVALDYEAYDQMAIEQLRALAARAREKWPIVRLALLHRTGRVALGEPSVIIAVSTPHRPQAFEACRFLIDQLKVDVAIWKKEIWQDGSGTWVHPAETGKRETGRRGDRETGRQGDGETGRQGDKVTR